MAAHLRARAVVGAQAGQVFGGALGDHVDAAAHAAVGRHAVHHGGRALEHFHPLRIVGQQPVVGRDAVEAVERHLANVVVADGEAADEEGVGHVAAGRGAAHRRVGRQGLAQRAHLSVGQRLGGVAGDVQGGVHHVRLAQQAQPAAACDLAAGIGRGQVVGRERGAGGHAHFTQRGARGGAFGGGGHGAQGVAAVRRRHGLQRRAGQQRGQRLRHRVFARHAGRGPAVGELRAEADQRARFTPQPVERRAQRAGGDGIALARRVGAGRATRLGLGRRRGQGAAQCEARAQQGRGQPLDGGVRGRGSDGGGGGGGGRSHGGGHLSGKRGRSDGRRAVGAGWCCRLPRWPCFP